jgi:hypothetical protein
MFEGLVYQLLASYLEHYVKDFQRERLRVGLWSGKWLIVCFTLHVARRIMRLRPIPFNY